MGCPECKGQTVYSGGSIRERVCTNCGLVLEKASLAQRFSPWNPDWPSKWVREDSETLKQWLTILRTVSCQLNLPNFPYREEAARLIRTKNNLFFQRQKLAKNKREAVAALMHLILREYGKDRSIKEICQQLSLNNKLVMKQTWNLKKQIKPKKERKQTRRRSSKDYLYKFGGELTSDNQLLIKAEKTLEKVQRKGGNPKSIAAGALYYECKLNKVNITKKTIGKTFSISHRTVDTNERKIRRLVNLIAAK
jgi:transcription initiation factor TFIIIB Brf1 subunit/transcription initiation factor TFIIB